MAYAREHSPVTTTGLLIKAVGLVTGALIDKVITKIMNSFIGKVVILKNEILRVPVLEMW